MKPLTIFLQIPQVRNLEMLGELFDLCSILQHLNKPRCLDGSRDNLCLLFQLLWKVFVLFQRAYPRSLENSMERKHWYILQKYTDQLSSIGLVTLLTIRCKIRDTLFTQQFRVSDSINFACSSRAPFMDVTTRWSFIALFSFADYSIFFIASVVILAIAF